MKLCNPLDPFIPGIIAGLGGAGIFFWGVYNAQDVATYLGIIFVVVGILIAGGLPDRCPPTN